MPSVLVIGSGASGVHFALSTLRKGYEVTMIDVGRTKASPLRPGETLNDLKSGLPDPAAYFLGPQFEAVVHPGSHTEYYTKYYGFPPSKSNVFTAPSTFEFEAKGFEPLFSFARGGLAEAWTAGVYPLNDHELAQFPFRYADIEPHYGEVARRIGVSGADDDLGRFFPRHAHLRKPLDLDAHSRHLVARYGRRRKPAGRAECYLGHSRVATLSSDTPERQGCIYCGRCLWGCPLEALYTPSITLRECMTYPNFHYVPDVYVSHFRYDDRRRVTGVLAQSLNGGSSREMTADRFVLAAGTLSSSKIVLESIFQATGNIVRLGGLMDNR
ncbi:MAG: GMC family oxidoreductase N-terminal domain-containing protein, partial [Candidatus Binatia bacterium]